ncbi:Fungal lipase-like domain,Alpha/Beta hydrolase fold [Cinara cedri]|uniref:Fungal lipase-like domain,Alpha/Beta hydrolase fold n=1 Tax=Cinara cedri TaxID=506608 RepID=A0A5E4MS46_9HEMI|nr:Fungal lipase-like domain,Alpha/Beta hydrolase fold [Cinara cedri]
MCTFSKMAHCSNDETLSKKGYKTRDKLSKEKYRVTLFNYSNGRDAGLIFKKGKEVTIAYCGSRTIGDFITGGSVLPTIPSFLVDERGKIYGRVHKGYYNAFQDSFNALESELEHYAKAQNLEIKDLKINFTGHSMGGALAKIAALCLNKTKGAQDIHVATFGDPRVFFEDAKEAYNEVLGENTIRVSQHRQDPVPAVIPGAAGYAHVGTQLRIEKSPSDFPHKMDGYYGVIKGHQQYHFRPNNSASLFYYPVQGLKVLNCMILGNSQSAIVNYSGKQYSTPTEEKWYKEALSLAKVKKESNTGNNPNTKINLNQINQVVGEIRYL